MSLKHNDSVHTLPPQGEQWVGAPCALRLFQDLIVIDFFESQFVLGFFIGQKGEELISIFHLDSIYSYGCKV